MIFVSPKVGKGDFPADYLKNQYRTQIHRDPTEKKLCWSNIPTHRIHVWYIYLHVWYIYLHVP